MDVHACVLAGIQPYALEGAQSSARISRGIRVFERPENRPLGPVSPYVDRSKTRHRGRKSHSEGCREPASLLSAPSVVCGLAGAALATTVAFRIPNRYLSEARLSVSGGELNRRLFLEQVVQPALSQSFLEELIRKNDLYATGRQEMPMKDAVHRMRKDIHIQFVGDRADPRSFAFVLQFAHRDPVQAQKITDELVASFVRANLKARIANPPGTDIEPRPTGVPTRVTVLGAASRPEAAGPNRLIVTAWGLALGLLAAALTALAMRLHRHPAVQT